MFLNRSNFNLVQGFYYEYVYRAYLVLSLYYALIMIAMAVITILKPKVKIAILFQVCTIVLSIVGLYILYTKIPTFNGIIVIPEWIYAGTVNYPLFYLIPGNSDVAELYSFEIEDLTYFLYNYQGITFLISLCFTVIASTFFKRKKTMSI